MDSEYISSPDYMEDAPQETQSTSKGDGHRRISNLAVGGLLAVAALFDLVNWIPVVNYIAAAAEVVVFGFWFWKLGIGWTNPRVFASGAVGLIVGAIPALSAVPETIASVAVIIALTTAEDKLGVKLPMPGTTGGISTPPPLPKV